MLMRPACRCALASLSLVAARCRVLPRRREAHWPLPFIAGYSWLRVCMRALALHCCVCMPGVAYAMRLLCAVTAGGSLVCRRVVVGTQVQGGRTLDGDGGGTAHTAVG